MVDLFWVIYGTFFRNKKTTINHKVRAIKQISCSILSSKTSLFSGKTRYSKKIPITLQWYKKSFFPKLGHNYFLTLPYVTYAAENVSIFGVILIPIFPYLDWIQRDMEYLSISVQKGENVDQNNSEHRHFSLSGNTMRIKFSKIS